MILSTIKTDLYNHKYALDCNLHSMLNKIKSCTWRKKTTRVTILRMNVHF